MGGTDKAADQREKSPRLRILAGTVQLLQNRDYANPDLRQHRLVLFVGALEIGELVIALKVPDSCGYFVNQVFVVRNQQNGPRIALQSNVQRIDGLEIQVV